MLGARTLASILAVTTATALAPHGARADEPPATMENPGGRPLPVSPPAPSVPLAVALEVVAPLGGAGCFYRRRYVAGALVVLGSAFTGGALLYAAHTSDRDGMILNAVGYSLMRVIGLGLVGRVDASLLSDTPAPPPPSGAYGVDPRPMGPPVLAATTIGLSHAFAF